MKMWTVQIRDCIACSVQSDLSLHCLQKFFVSLLVRKELTVYQMTKINTGPTIYGKQNKCDKKFKFVMGMITSVFSFCHNVLKRLFSWG